MNLKAFAELAGLDDVNELEKTRLLAFYFHTQINQSEIEISMIIDGIIELHFNKPNTSRLSKKIRTSPEFVSATNIGCVKLHARSIKELEKRFPALMGKRCPVPT
jgi:hypothetical protein